MLCRGVLGMGVLGRRMGVEMGFGLMETLGVLSRHRPGGNRVAVGLDLMFLCFGRMRVVGFGGVRVVVLMMRSRGTGRQSQPAGKQERDRRVKITHIVWKAASHSRALPD
jgi:hypothetical protein